MIKHAEEILVLLELVKLPADIVIMHVKAHSKQDTQISKGNQRADETAKAISHPTFREIAINSNFLTVLFAPQLKRSNQI